MPKALWSLVQPDNAQRKKSFLARQCLCSAVSSAPTQYSEDVSSRGPLKGTFSPILKFPFYCFASMELSSVTPPASSLVLRQLCPRGPSSSWPAAAATAPRGQLLPTGSGLI